MRYTSRGLAVLGLGAGLGAGLMYLLDPTAGRRRRATMGNKASHFRKVSARYLHKAACDLEHRAQGLVAETRQLWKSGEAPDDVLIDRVRAELGRHGSHPRAIHVDSRNGHIMLFGHVLAHELDEILRAVRSVRGVTEVSHRLETHKHPRGIAVLQGGPGPREARAEWFQENWSPGARLIAGGIGLGMIGYGLRKHRAVGAVGSLLLARSSTNMPFFRLFGIGNGRRGITLQKTVHIQAPVDRVYRFWTDFGSYPKFLRHVREVRTVGTHRMRWRVDGPFGLPVEWDAEITSAKPNQLISWKSEPGSSIKQAGVVHFETDRQGGTRVHLRFTYNPPGGGLAHAAAKVLRVDPKHQFDDDMARIKTFLETGSSARDAAGRS